MNTTIDKKEIDFFSKLSDQWWNLQGLYSPLHKLADVRIKFILRNLERKKNNLDLSPLKNISCIDLGCGGGILSERLARMGGNITAIDASKESIQVAKNHAKTSGLKVNYIHTSSSDFLKKNKNKKFDLVIASEIIEHVNDRDKFLSDISSLSKKGSIIIITTINSSFISIFFSKFMAENVLKILPQGTHDIKKFVSPNALAEEAKKYSIFFDDVVGFQPQFSINSLLNKQIESFKITNYPIVNYGLAGLKLS
tara:strand:+ start:392 stop:1150 length:759 start_codon:yes stop_codon:yes gene_type:complete